MHINELHLSVPTTVGNPLSCRADAEQLLTSDINPSVVTRTFVFLMFSAFTFFFSSSFFFSSVFNVCFFLLFLAFAFSCVFRVCIFQRHEFAATTLEVPQRLPVPTDRPRLTTDRVIVSVPIERYWGFWSSCLCVPNQACLFVYISRLRGVDSVDFPSAAEEYALTYCTGLLSGLCQS